MITTICLNPALDRTVTVDRLVPGEVNRIRTARTDVGGKAVNVARVCRRLGLSSQVIGCAGVDGYGKLRDAMQTEGVGCYFHSVEGAIRVNTKVVPLDGAPVTELNEPGPTLTAEDLDVFFDMAIEHTRHSDFAVITGSLPPGCPADTYRRLMEALAPVPCVLDVSGEALLHGVEAKPLLIKPNHHELAATLGRAANTLEDIRAAAQVFLDKGVTHVVVSLGGDGALYVGAEGCCYAPVIPVPVRSTVGAGDAMVGGLLYGYLHGGTMREGFRAGVAAGTASVMTEGTQLIVPGDFTSLLARVQLQEK
ncbi:MAG: 1-phosphofructokinase family hexose kinase [Clostridiales bacterium]|nr:1-phosphofructokinase family hexose kinase [Clostridiales bacterium]